MNTSSLTFTTSNWGTAQTVTVSAGEDADAADDTATLRHTASGWRLRERDGGRVGDGRRRRVGGSGSVEDVDQPGRGEQRELHGEAVFGADGAGDGGDYRDVEYGPESEHVEPDVHDVELGYGADGDGERGRGRRRGGRHGDASAHGFGGDYASETADVSVTVDDDESVGLVLSKTSINPGEGSSESYTVKLSSEPTAQVTVAITGTSSTDLTLNTSSLTFTTSNWGTAQTVTVSAGEDADATDDTATLRHTASGGDYASETADVSVTVDDDESVGLVLSKTSINPGEGSSESYTVKLSSEPTASVTVAITGTSGTDLSLNTTSLTFTTSSWGTAQTVTVSAGEDADATDDTATLRHTASGRRLRGARRRTYR